MSKEEQPGNVVLLTETAGKKDTRRASEKKWGKPVVDYGFCIIPSLLLHAQERLGINAVQLNIIMHLADFWWVRERMPYPSKAVLAHRMGLSERQIQRQMVELEEAGLVGRVQRTRPGRGKTTNAYDLTGLVKRLQELEPEFTQVKQEAKARKRDVSRPRHRRQATTPK